MYIANVIVVVLALLSSSAIAEKAPYEYNPVTAGEIRQGGDTIETAVSINWIPATFWGTTTGYADDYDEVCPYDLPGAADVVYKFEYLPCWWGDHLEAELCSSSFDTKLYVYENTLDNLIACNDDFCPGYMSELSEASGQRIPVSDGNTYYIVIDGYSPGDDGDYQLNIGGNLFQPTAVEEISFSRFRSLYR